MLATLATSGKKATALDVMNVKALTLLLVPSTSKPLPPFMV